MAAHPSFPPDTSPASPQEAEYSRTGYYGPSRRPPSDFANQLRDWIDVVVRGRWWILAAVVAVGIPVTLYALLAPNEYQSTARLYVESDGGDAATQVMPGGEGFLQQSPIADELYILQNAEDLAEATAEEILNRAGGADGPLTILETEDEQEPTLELVAARVPSYVTIAQDGQGVNGVRVTAQSRSPYEAALIANLYAEAYVERTQTSSRASVAASREFLESQADSVRRELAAREEAARSYMDEQNAVRLDEEASNIVSQLAGLEAERDQARVEAGMLAARIRQLESEISALEPSLAQRLRSSADRERQQAEARMQDLRQQLDVQQRTNPESPTIAQIERQIAEQQRIIDRTSDQLVDEAIAAGGVDPSASGLPRLSALRDQLSSARVELSGTRSRIQILNGRIGEYQSDLERIPEQSVELARLMRDRETTERLANGLNQKLQEARVAESAQLGYAEIIRAASTPFTPVAPNRGRILLLGLMIGLGLGLVLAIGRDQFDQHIRRPDDIRQAGYPLLGVIPSTDDLIKEDFGGKTYIDIDGRQMDTRLTALLAPTSTAAEAFRGLRTSVQFSRPDTVVRRILVTSGSPGEGKSTVAANLATVMAQSGRRTLLVDCDLRRSRVHKVFGLTRSPGLTDFLTNSGELKQSLKLTVADGLDVLPAGSPVPNPSEHLGSRALRELLSTLEDAYDVIILDAPPLMAATDPVLLSTQVDATILVAAAGKTKDYELAYVRDELDYVGAHVIGVVLNRFDVQKEYGYRYQYQYRYGSRYSYGNEG